MFQSSMPTASPLVAPISPGVEDPDDGLDQTIPGWGLIAALHLWEKMLRCQKIQNLFCFQNNFHLYVVDSNNCSCNMLQTRPIHAGTYMQHFVHHHGSYFKGPITRNKKLPALVIRFGICNHITLDAPITIFQINPHDSWCSYPMYRSIYWLSIPSRLSRAEVITWWCTGQCCRNGARTPGERRLRSWNGLVCPCSLSFWFGIWSHRIKRSSFVCRRI